MNLRHKHLLSLLVFCLLPPILAAEDPLTWDNLEQYLAQEAEAGFTGAVLIVRDGEVVLNEGYGLANREKQIPIRADTVFAVGSQPIDFTHAAILSLAQEEKLSLSDPITAFFDDVPPDKQAITVDHLMSGASGLPNFHDLPTDRDPDHAWIDRDEAVRRIFAQDLLFAPGEGDAHSHSAWGLLAAIVEIVSGQSYEEFTREHIFEPAGMTDTGFHGDPVPEERLAIGYGLRMDGEINAPPYWGKTSWLVMGSGGQISTAGDISRFLTAMRQGEILEPEWAERFFGPGVGANRNGNNYGFEMFVYHTPMAESHAVMITNANKPSGPGGMDDTQFVRVSRRIGNFLLEPHLPKYSLGVQLEPVEDGVRLARVVPGSAAERDGLETGDILISAGGMEFGDDPLAVLDPYLASGDEIVFVLRRGEREIEVTVRPDPRR